MLNYKRHWIRYVISALVCLVLAVNVCLEIRQTRSYLEEENKMLVEENVTAARKAIETNIGYAENRIRVIANEVGMSMTGPELMNPQHVLKPYVEKSPFSFIEYVRKDGINILSDGRKLDVRDREYYREGIKGIADVWANFSPAVSKEVLINYYTPLYYKGEIVGVLTGVVGGDSRLKNLLKDDVFGKPCYSLLCNQEGKLISSNLGHTLGQSIDTVLVSKGITVDEVAAIKEAMASNSKKIFTLNRGSNYSLVGLAKVKDVDCYVLEIIPDNSIAAINNRVLIYYYGILGALGLMLLLIFFIYRMDSRLKKAVDAAEKELSISTAIANMYNSLHIIDLSTDTAEEYMSNDAVRYWTSQRSKASESLALAMQNLSKPEWVERTLTFSDLTTLQERLQDCDHTMLDFEGIHYWVRAFFAVMKRDEAGKAVKVLFVTRIIDKYMKDLESLHRKSNVDQLTGILNRRAYEDTLKEHANVPLPENFVYVSVDVNGLKTVNDNMGHAAGDDLLKGAATCLARCLGSYGSVYRMGGDEFTALLFVDKAKLEEIKQDLESTTRAWQGSIVKELHMACGYAAKADYPDADLSVLAAEADKLMYAAKEEYYSNKGLDRRRQQYVFDAVCSSYTKILRVNLTDDSYTIIRLNEEERNDPNRPKTISAWLRSFGNSSGVYAEDRESFMEGTKPEKLRDFFKLNKGHYTVYYRRNIDGHYKYAMFEVFAAAEYTHDMQIVYLLVKDLGNSDL